VSSVIVKEKDDVMPDRVRLIEWKGKVDYSWP
jgi:hypothetical protein